MRFRNVPNPNGDSSGNGRTTLLGRITRSRVFVAMDTGRPFDLPDLPDARPTLITDEGVDSVGPPLDSRERRAQAMGVVREEGSVNWKMEPEVPVPSMSDNLPPRREPVDGRRGGVDHVAIGAGVPSRTYDVTGANTSRDLNVTSPTATNVAQVLSELLTDLQNNGIIRKV